MGLSKYTGSNDNNLHHVLQPLDIPQLVNLKIEEGPSSQRRWFNYSIRGLTGCAILSGMYFTTLMRKSMKVYEAVLPTHVLVGVSTSVFHFFGFSIAVQSPAAAGNLCPVCATIRGSVVQVVTACVLPSLTSALLTALMADRYKSAQVPEITYPIPKEFKDFWRSRYRKLWGRAWPMLITQVIIGGFVGYKQYKIAQDVRKTITEDEYNQLWSQAIKSLNEFENF